MIFPLKLLPCPFCGNADEREIKVQTPVCDDGRHRDAYIPPCDLQRRRLILAKYTRRS